MLSCMTPNPNEIEGLFGLPNILLDVRFSTPDFGLKRERARFWPIRSFLFYLTIFYDFPKNNGIVGMFGSRIIFAELNSLTFQSERSSIHFRWGNNPHHDTTTGAKGIGPKVGKASNEYNKSEQNEYSQRFLAIMNLYCCELALVTMGKNYL